MEKVAKKIFEDAEKEKKKILESTNEEMAQIKRETEEELTKLENETSALVNEALSRERRRNLGMATLSIRNELLQTKREIMDHIFREALESLVSKGRSEYLAFIKELIKQTEAKEGELIVGAQEDRIDDKFIEEVNRELGTNFSLSKGRVNIKGGFILRHGRIEIDASFSAILNAGRDKIELELAKLLF